MQQFISNFFYISIVTILSSLPLFDSGSRDADRKGGKERGVWYATKTWHETGTLWLYCMGLNHKTTSCHICTNLEKLLQQHLFFIEAIRHVYSLTVVLSTKHLPFSQRRTCTCDPQSTLQSHSYVWHRFLSSPQIKHFSVYNMDCMVFGLHLMQLSLKRGTCKYLLIGI